MSAHLDAEAVRAGVVDWRVVLHALGVDEQFLRGPAVHGPCPLCGGKDRYRFDDKGSGRYYCNQCGAGNGFQLLMKLHHWTFPHVLKEGAAVIGLAEPRPTRRPVAPPPPRPCAPPDPSVPRRVRTLLRESCPAEWVEDVTEYLRARHIWPLPAGTTLRAHVAAPYWQESDEGPRMAGKFAALVARVVDVADTLVTAHVTYLAQGKKLDIGTPRKLWSSLQGRVGCCARLFPVAPTIGVAEGIETALAAAMLHDLPVWACLNAGLLAKWEPPPEVTRVIIFADRDVAGLEAAQCLAEHLQGRVPFSTSRLPALCKDWCDALGSRAVPREPGVDDHVAEPYWWERS